ncbi:MAG TPA: alpha/beta hydrolase [Candidatus Cybelea sp.]|nr:alpha/beta hydrolase [Candidatus Cybelea sp.]
MTESPPTVLFVHGWQADRSVWGGVIAALDAEVRCIDVDLRGSGELRDIPGPYTLERFAADLREIAERIEGGPAIVVGHSMGATIALRLAVDAPHLVRALVLVAPVPAGGPGYSSKGAEFLRKTVGDRDHRRKWLARTFAGEPVAEHLDQLCDAAERTSSQAALESFESWTNADFAEETRAITMPAVVIAPEHDAPDVHEQKVAALLPNARFVLLRESGHYALLEKPQDIADAIRSVLAP